MVFQRAIYHELYSHPQSRRMFAFQILTEGGAHFNSTDPPVCKAWSCVFLTQARAHSPGSSSPYYYDNTPSMSNSRKETLFDSRSPRCTGPTAGTGGQQRASCGTRGRSHCWGSQPVAFPLDRPQPQHPQASKAELPTEPCSKARTWMGHFMLCCNQLMCFLLC